MKTLKYDVPFYANPSDNTHCVQAAYKMILEYFLPEKAYSFEELSKITGKSEKGGAWAAKGHIWLVDQGFELEYWSLIDWPAFIREGYDYVKKTFGKEIADQEAAHGNIPLEQKRAAAALKKVKTLQKEPHIQDITDFLEKGYLVKCKVNARKLHGQEGYEGHAIVVTGFTPNAVIIHDPGLPPAKNRKIPFEQFEAAWASPNKTSKELDAIRLER